MSEYMKDHYKMDNDGSFKNQDEIDRAVKDGNLKEYDSRYIDVDGNEYYKDGSPKPSSFW